jgi:hypothetical protein
MYDVLYTQFITYETTMYSLEPKQQNIMKRKWNIFAPISKVYKTQYRKNKRI